MFSFKEAIKSPDYWLTGIQIDLYNHLIKHLKDTHKTKGELAAEMGVSNAYVSQILNGSFNFTLKKFIQICLHLGKVPIISFKPLEELLAEHEAQKATLQKQRASKALCLTTDAESNSHKDVVLITANTAPLSPIETSNPSDYDMIKTDVTNLKIHKKAA